MIISIVVASNKYREETTMLKHGGIASVDFTESFKVEIICYGKASSLIIVSKVNMSVFAK